MALRWMSVLIQKATSDYWWQVCFFYRGLEQGFWFCLYLPKKKLFLARFSSLLEDGMGCAVSQLDLFSLTLTTNISHKGFQSDWLSLSGLFVSLLNFRSWYWKKYYALILFIFVGWAGFALLPARWAFSHCLGGLWSGCSCLVAGWIGLVGRLAELAV